MMKKIILFSSLIVLSFSCNKNDDEDNEVLCQNDNSTDQNSHQCTTTPSVSSTYSESINGDNRVISTNGIPSHDYRNQIHANINFEVDSHTSGIRNAFCALFNISRSIEFCVRPIDCMQTLP